MPTLADNWTTFLVSLHDGSTMLNLRGTSWESGGIFLISLDLGFPTPRAVVSDAPGVDGTLDYTSNFGARTVTAVLKVKGDDSYTVNQYLDQLRTLSAPNKRITMTVSRDGWASPRNITLRAQQFSCIINKVSHIAADVTMAWEAPSGVLSDVSFTYTDLHPLSGGSGWVVPSGAVNSGALTVTSGAINSPSMTVLSGTSSNTGLVTNNGTLPAYPIFTIAGYCESPVIINLNNGKRLAFTNLAVVGGFPLIIDTFTRKVTVAGISVYSYIDWTVSSWFTFPVGNTDIQFQATNQDGNCFLDISFLPRYI